MPTEKRALRTFDFTSVPEGPHGEFPRQLVETFDALISTSEELSERIDAATAEPARTRPIRVKGITNAWSDPYVVDPALYPTETIFDDVEATAPVQFNLPTSAEVVAAGVDPATEIIRYGFRRTTAYTLRVKAPADHTLGVDSIPESVDGGTLDLLSANGYVIFELVDDQWRGVWTAGEFEVDA